MFVSYKLRSFIGKSFGYTYSITRYLNLESNSLFHWNSKITSYFRKRNVESARKLFDEIPHKNVVTWNCMISGYIKNRMIREAREVFESMPSKNIVSCTAMLSGYAKNGRLEEARALFDAIEKKNVVCWNSMISGYVNNGKIKEGRLLFDEMPVKNDVSWSVMIEGYFKDGDVTEAERLFNEASSESILICNTMLSGYCETGQVTRANNLFIRMVTRDVASWTCMITCFVRTGDMESARRMFDEMPERDVVAWTVMIRGYLDSKRIESAQDLFYAMPYRDTVAWNLMLKGHIQYEKFENAIDFFMRMPNQNLVSWNLMLWGYVQQDDMISARNFFEEIPMKDETSWNTIISGYQNEEAMILYVHMLCSGFKPDQGSLTSVISVCGILASHVWGKAMHVFVVKIGCESDSMVMSSLISMYSKCGFINDATRVFNSMEKLDTIAWNAIIVARAHHFSAKQALDLFPSMIDSKCQPDHVTFLILLTTCAHSGLVNEGFKFLKLMENWNLFPEGKHYASIVDLLGRSGFLSEALDLVNRLPLDLPAYTWETLLSACNIHENYKLSELVAKKILSCESCDVGMSVLQANMYSARGMWNDAARVRDDLKRDKILKKDLGCSWIDVNGSISCFA